METLQFDKVEVLDLIEKNGIEVSKNQSVIDSFLNFYGHITKWREQAATLTITSVDQKSEMKIAREARLALKGIRVEVEHTRKRLKEDSLRTGQTIDAIAKILTNEIAPIERHLEEQEKFAENQEKARKALLRSTREAALAPYAIETQHYNLEEMTDESFDSLLKASAIAFQEKQAAIAKAEADRIAQEKAEAEAREAQRVENERLKAEAEAMRKEKEEAEKLARQEREAREALEKEKAAKEAAEKAAQEKAEKARIKAEKAEKSRPDKEKLLAFAAEIKALMDKDLGITSEECLALLETARRSLRTVANTLIGETNAL